MEGMDAGPSSTVEAGRVLVDPARQAEFDADGYTIVPFLSSEEVATLLDGYARIVPEADETVIAFDYTREDRAAMQAVRALLAPVFERHLPAHFTGHEAVFWTFVIKPPGPHGELSLHDDRTYVDERRNQACTVWIPLVDTSPELDNGCLCVVPRSHLIMPVASGTNIPNWIAPYESYLRRHSRPLTVTAGSALIYNTKTLHFSPPNRSDRVRPAIAAAVVPVGEQLVHVVGEGLHRRRVYAVDREFFVDHHPFAVEQEMPHQYQLIDEYWEERIEADPEAVGRVGDPGDTPVPSGPVVAPVPRKFPPGAGPPPAGSPPAPDIDRAASVASPGAPRGPADAPSAGGRSVIARLRARLGR